MTFLFSTKRFLIHDIFLVGVFQCLVCRLLEHCQRYVASKQSNLTQWHPILGWFSSNDKCSPPLDVQQTTPLVKQQLSYLWTVPLLQHLTQCIPVAERSQTLMPRVESHADEKNLVTAFKKALSSNSNSGAGSKSGGKNSTSNQPVRKLGSPEVTQVALVCSMFQTALCTLTQMRMDILTGMHNLTEGKQSDLLNYSFDSVKLQGESVALFMALHQLVRSSERAENLFGFFGS
jgi:hypothetical protein